FGGPGLGLVLAAARQADGNILVGGSAGSAAMLLRYSASGVLDTSFGSNGVAALALGTAAQIGGIALQNDQKIVVVGEFDAPKYAPKTFVARFLATGALDVTFGTDGRVIADGFGSSLAIQADGAILASAYATGGLTVYRFTSAGAPDATFGVAGVAKAN